MLKKPESKSDIRSELEQETERFLGLGGEVENVPRGISGKNANEPPTFLNQSLFVEPRTKRTLVPEVVAAIEARRQKKRSPTNNKRSRPPQPRWKIIYDDFGEPLRKVLVEE